MTLKVIVDTDVFLSYLLAPETERPITKVVRACFTEDIDLVVPSELLTELVEKLTTKPYFRERVPQPLIDDFFAQITLLQNDVMPLETIPTFSRDPDDDYLIAYGLFNEVDYLVTDDMDLLVLRQVANLKIISPRLFLGLLSQAS